MSTVALWAMDKTVALTGERRHLHKGGIVAPGFTPPPLAPRISFGPTALAAAIGRTATLRAAPPELLAHMGKSALAEAQILFADGPGFALSPLFAHLADTERTHFASRVGAGITDLYMNALGYGWRDNAASLASTLDPHGDFLYFGGNALGHGVVLAEARGSFSKTTSDATMARTAANKYLRQVRPYIGALSQHGRVVHGYAIAFGAQPNLPGAFLRLSQTLRTKAKGGADSPPPPLANVRVPTTMALATHRSNFILMNALQIADWIDWVRGGRDFPERSEPVGFVRFEFAGRSFLASLDALLPYGLPVLWHNDLYDELFWRRHRARHWPRNLPSLPFVMEEKAAKAFLTALTGLIRLGPRERGDYGEGLELPNGDIVGFGAEDADLTSRGSREGYDFALFRDGLALISGPPRRRSVELIQWHPKEGFEGL